MKHLQLLEALLLCIFCSGQINAQTAGLSSCKPSDLNTGEVKLANNNLNFTTGAIAPYRYGDKVYFTVKVPKKSGTGMVSRLYSAIGNEAAIPQLINPKEEGINVGEATLSVGGDRIYYTAFKESKGDKPTQSEIWYRDKQYDGSWGHVVMLPNTINQAEVINKQPTSGYDLKLKKEVLYFSSNRPGGKGGFDIWCCTIERDGTFGKLVNMPFNTANDEVTPFFYTHAQMIFFSSNMPGGMGGFDIYRTSKTAAGVWQAGENLSMANTNFDELYFSYHQPSQISYFCSNRPSLLNPGGAGQFAIFMGKLTGSILVSTMSEMDSAALYGCNIELENMETGVIEVTILRSENNNLDLPIFPGKKYRLIVSHKGFYPVFLQLETMNADFANPIRKTVYLKPMK